MSCDSIGLISPDGHFVYLASFVAKIHPLAISLICLLAYNLNNFENHLGNKKKKKKS